MGLEIWPKYFWVRGIAGLEVSEVRFPATTGLHVLFGSNNSGKSRILNGLATALACAEISARDVDPAQLGGQLESPLRNIASWQSLPDIKITWPRGYVPLSVSAEDSRLSVITIASLTGLAMPQFSGASDTTRKLIQAYAPTLRVREARYISSQRLFPATGNLNNDASIDAMINWPAHLATLESHREDRVRIMYRSIQESFTILTGGLSLTVRGEGATRAVYIQEPGGQAREIDGCGDGLRDLIGILLFVIEEPEKDLLIDEPGLRLHARSQRELVKFLYDHSQNRSIWLATHEAAIVGAPAIRSRVAVQRIIDKQLTTAMQVITRDEIRVAQAELGWLPQDVFLADRVLFCEGESDRVIFSELLRLAAETDPRFGGTVVAELGGDGDIIGKDPKRLYRTVSLVTQMAPHARYFAVIDGGDRSGRQVEAVRQKLQEMGVFLAPLKRYELENYYLDELELLSASLNSLTRHVIPPVRIELDTLRPLLAGITDTVSASQALDAICQDHLHCQLDKVKVSLSMALALGRDSSRLRQLCQELLAIMTT